MTGVKRNFASFSFSCQREVLVQSRTQPLTVPLSSNHLSPHVIVASGTAPSHGCSRPWVAGNTGPLRCSSPALLSMDPLILHVHVATMTLFDNVSNGYRGYIENDGSEAQGSRISGGHWLNQSFRVGPTFCSCAFSWRLGAWTGWEVVI